MYLVYILVCDNLSYIGMTNDFLNRWLQHNGIISGGAKYTRKKSNWYPICIIDGFLDKSQAMQCEWKLKNKFYKSTSGNKFKLILNHTDRIKYLNSLLKGAKWTKNSPYIKTQNLKIFIDKEYEDYIDYINTEELYWK